MPKRLMGRVEITAGGTAGVIGPDAPVDVAGIERNVGVLGGVRLTGSHGGDIEGERRGSRCALRQGGRGGKDADRKLESERGHVSM